LRNEFASTYEPEALASDIAGQLGWDTASMPKRPSTRYVRDLCRWLLGRSIHENEAVLVILDGFHHKDLHGETRDMVQELIRQVSANTSRFSLLLLNFPKELIPANPPGVIQHEDLSTLTTTDLTDFFSTLYRQKGRVPEKAVIDIVVRSVLAPVPPDEPNYNE